MEEPQEIAEWQPLKFETKLHHNSGVVSLNLSKTGLGDAGAIHMSTLVQNSHTLQELNLGDNELTHISAAVFLRILGVRIPTRLLVLILSLTQRLDYNVVALRKINFARNRIPQDMERALTRVMNRRRTVLQKKLVQQNQLKVRSDRRLWRCAYYCCAMAAA